MYKDYRSIRHCFYCGRGISQKYRVIPETALMLAVFGYSAGACNSCAKKIEAKISGK